MKVIEESTQTYEFRLEEVLKTLVPNQTPNVDFDNATMKLKDGNTVLVLQVTVSRTK